MPPQIHQRTGTRERVEARRTQALDMRVGGASYRQIAARLNVSRQTAYKDVQAELALLDVARRRSTERLRELELERCDRLIVGLWAMATPQLARDPRTGNPLTDEGGHPVTTTPDLGAVSAILRAMERRSRLLGLDAPTRIDATVSRPLYGVTEDALQDRLRLLRSRIGQRTDDVLVMPEEPSDGEE